MKTGISLSRNKRQILDHYLKGVCNITSYYGIFKIEFLSSKPNHSTRQIQADDIDIEFSKVFTDYIKNIHRNSERASSIFTYMFSQKFIAIYLY